MKKLRRIASRRWWDQHEVQEAEMARSIATSASGSVREEEQTALVDKISAFFAEADKVVSELKDKSKSKVRNLGPRAERDGTKRGAAESAARARSRSATRRSRDSQSTDSSSESRTAHLELAQEAGEVSREVAEIDELINDTLVRKHSASKLDTDTSKTNDRLNDSDDDEFDDEGDEEDDDFYSCIEHQLSLKSERDLRQSSVRFALAHSHDVRRESLSADGERVMLTRQRVGLGGDEVVAPYRLGVEMIFNGNFSTAERFFATRVKRCGEAPASSSERSATRIDTIRYAWSAKKPHPRDILLMAEAVMLKVWLTGEKSDSVRAVDMFTSAVERAESAIKDIEAALGRLSHGADARQGVLRFDLEDCRLVLAEGTFFRACMQLLGGHTVRGLYNLRRAWNIYEGSAIHKRAATTDFAKVLFGNNISSTVACTSSAALSQGVFLDEEGLCWPRMNSARDEDLAQLEKQVCHDLGAREYIGFGASWRFGVGFYLRIVSMAPPTLVKVLEAVGFIADRELGLQLLIEAFAPAVQSDGVPWHASDVPPAEACVKARDVPLRAMLCMHTLGWDLLDISFDAQLPGEPLSDSQRLIIGQRATTVMLERFPSSPKLLWLESVSLRRQGRLDEALSQLELAAQAFRNSEGLRSTALESGVAMPQRMMSNAVLLSMMLRRHEDTQRYGMALLKVREKDDFPVEALVGLGLCAVQLGDVKGGLLKLREAADLHVVHVESDSKRLLHQKAGTLLRRAEPTVMYAEFMVATFSHEQLLAPHLKQLADELRAVLPRLEKAAAAAAPAASLAVPTAAANTSSAPFGKLKQFVSSAAGTSNADPQGPDKYYASDELVVAKYCIGALLRVLHERSSDVGSAGELAEESSTLLKHCAASNSRFEKWLGPFAYYEQIRLELSAKRYDRAAAALSELKAASAAAGDYEGEHMIVSRRKKLKELVDSALVAQA